jgi:anti-sigma factor RsiW
MCPDKNLLSAYFDGELDERFASQIEAHIEECDSCRQVLYNFGEISSLLCNSYMPSGDPGSARTRDYLETRFSSLYPTPVWKRRLLVPAPVLAAVAVLFIVLGVGLLVSLSTGRENQVFDSVTRTRIEGVHFVTFDQILEYLDARGNGSAFIFTLPQHAKLQFHSEPTLMKASDFKRGRD